MWMMAVGHAVYSPTAMIIIAWGNATGECLTGKNGFD
jgi:hypothetical protein